MYCNGGNVFTCDFIYSFHIRLVSFSFTRDGSYNNGVVAYHWITIYAKTQSTRAFFLFHLQFDWNKRQQKIDPNQKSWKTCANSSFFSLHFIIFSSHIPVNSIKEEKKEVKNNGWINEEFRLRTIHKAHQPVLPVSFIWLLCWGFNGEKKHEISGKFLRVCMFRSK